MKGYSRSREDYLHILYSKYFKMKEAIFIEWDDCVRCFTMKPHAQRWCEDNGYEFQVFRFDDTSVSEFDVQSVPTLVLKENGEVKQILNEEWMVWLISGKDLISNK